MDSVIRFATIDDESKISLFLKKTESAMIYYTSTYLKFIKDTIKDTDYQYILIETTEEIIALFPIVIKDHSLYGLVINSLPFFGSHGGIVTTQNENIDLLTDKVIDFLESTFNNISSITLIENPFSKMNEKVLEKKGYKIIDERIGQITTLPNSSENLPQSLFDILHVKTRNAVRKGQKSAQRIERKNDIESLKWLQATHEQSIKNLNGTYKTMDVFDNLDSNFDLNKDLHLYIGSIDNTPVSGLLAITYKETVEYFTPVSDENYRDQQVLSDLIFNVMMIFIKQKYKFWNWGGTWLTQEGVYRFKNRWGAADYPYRYFNKTKSYFYEFPIEDLKKEFPFFYLYKY